jgi:hypothetical protein
MRFTHDSRRQRTFVCESFVVARSLAPERHMSQPHDKKDDVIRIDLNDAQKAQVKQATGKDAESIELNAQELEERIAPFSPLADGDYAV